MGCPINHFLLITKSTKVSFHQIKTQRINFHSPTFRTAQEGAWEHDHLSVHHEHAEKSENRMIWLYRRQSGELRFCLWIGSPPFNTDIALSSIWGYKFSGNWRFVLFFYYMHAEILAELMTDKHMHAHIKKNTVHTISCLLIYRKKKKIEK